MINAPSPGGVVEKLFLLKESSQPTMFTAWSEDVVPL
jgi:hypothetical protein